MNSIYSVSQSRLVPSPFLREVEQVLSAELKIENINISSTKSEWLSDFWKELSIKIYDWIRPVVPEISEFPYLYQTQGITHGLNLLAALHSEAQFYQFEGDYGWLKNLGVNIEELPAGFNDFAKNSFLYYSMPFAGNGNIETWAKRNLGECSTIVDGAYVGTFAPKTQIILPSNTKYFLMSLSKPFGLGSTRSGVIFSKEPILPLEKLLSAGYLDALSMQLYNVLIDHFDLYHAHRRLSEFQSKVCQDMDFQPSDSVLLATTTKKEFAYWRRVGEQARMSLMPFYQQIQPELFVDGDSLLKV